MKHLVRVVEHTNSDEVFTVAESLTSGDVEEFVGWTADEVVEEAKLLGHEVVEVVWS